MVLDVEDPNRRSAGSFFKNPVLGDDGFTAVVEGATSAGVVMPPAMV